MGTEAKSATRQSKTTSKVQSKTAAPRKSSAASAAAPAARQRSARKSEPQQITAEARLHYIEEAAYYIAEKRGFSGGNPSEDWVAAEQQVDSLLLAGQLPT